MLYVIIRTIGIVALFWSCWPLALLLLILKLISNSKSTKPITLITNKRACLVIDYMSTVIGLLGIWFFPLVGPLTAHIAAVVAGIIVFIDIFYQPATDKLPESPPTRE